MTSTSPRTALAVAVLALAFGLAGCAGLLTGGPLIADPDGPTGQLVVANESGVTVSSVLISGCRVSSYGLNRMARGETIAPGGRRAFTVSPGCWDVLAGNSGAQARQRLDVAAGGTTTYTVYD